MYCKRIYTILLVITVLGIINVPNAFAQLTGDMKSKILDVVTSTVPANTHIGKIQLKSISVDNNNVVNVDLKESYSYYTITNQSIADLKQNIKNVLGDAYSSYVVNIQIEGSDIENFVGRGSGSANIFNKEAFITPLDESYHFKKGLFGNIIALWQSHGWYFEPKLNRWEWQRARIFQTVEDLYTQSYVMPYLMPMLENAGAYVMSPRERDININEVIVDEDGGYAQPTYEEFSGKQRWKSGSGNGFAYKRTDYREKQNPFNEGSYRKVKASVQKDKLSTAKWYAEIPEDGEYAVYISYVTLPESASDVTYTVNSEAGRKQFRVNQQMGGGTWIYLGHFPLKKGKQKLPVVELTNFSEDKKAVVTADAVKIGGGYGNIARIVKGLSENVKSSDSRKEDNKTLPDIDYEYQVSLYPRFTEAARYWMQWAGIPDSIYSPSGEINDYTDDYKSRGSWVNYLAGGSSVLPKRKGLNIPVDMAFAFHSDAGTTKNDSIIGTLGIYYSNNFSKYANGMPRIESRRLTDLIMTNIVSDIRALYEPNWSRRGMWDKSYFEARVPEVPTMLLELLSHQNFADMKYGLDPNFRFTVSRAIYKGMLQFLAKRDNREYQVQPLPVNSFAITQISGNGFSLSWVPTHDKLAANSDPSEYIVFERTGNGAFRELGKTSNTIFNVTVNDNKIHSYKIVAANDGGRSFPSEVLAVGLAKESKGMVMIVNGFTRVSAPDWFDAGEIAGFYDVKDHGVPYMNDINFIGSQFEFRRNIPWMDDDAAGFGASRANYETKVIKGNTFDYPYIHGKAIHDAGYSFISSSVKAVEDGIVNLNDYKIVDLILGKQKEVPNGRGFYPNRYKAFTPQLRNLITSFCENGGNIFVSGSFVASDIWDKKNVDKQDIKFAENILGYKWRVGQASVTGEAYTVPSVYKELKKGEYSFFNELNDEMYAVESPDSLYPSDDSTGSTFMRYRENNLVAGILTSRNNYKTCVIGFPFETIKDGSSRSGLMEQILNFFDRNK